MLRVFKEMNPKRMALAILLIALEAFGFLLLPTLAADLIDRGILANDQSTVIFYGVVMLISAVITISISIWGTRIVAGETQGMGNALRKKMFHRIMHFSTEDVDRFGTSTLVTRTTNDVFQVQIIAMMGVRLLVLSPIVVVIASILALRREPNLGFVFAIILPLLILLVYIIMKWASPYYRQIQNKTDRLNQIFREGLTGIRVIRAFNTTEYEEERFDAANQDYRHNAITGFTISNGLLPVSIIILGLSNLLIFTFGTRFIAQGEMEIGNLIAFSNYGVQIMVSIMQLGMLAVMVPRLEVSANRIYEVIDFETSVKNPDQPQSLDTGQTSLEFDDVEYRFEGAEKPALKDIDFQVNKGETLAIIGGTGSGKTTIANLIPRLMDVTAGAVKVNGVDIRDVDQYDLRRRIGYATQKAVLFSGTIRSNLAYGRPNATDEEMWHALDVAQGKDFVEGLPGGLDAEVEQGGVNFSGGQRQRLSIARALVTQAHIYVFDDTFSALDFETDAKLRRALKPETTDAVIVIIAQRVNTVMNADQIIVLDQGEVVGRGTHQELIESNDVYRDIVNSQTKGDEVE